MRGATRACPLFLPDEKFQSTPPVRGATTLTMVGCGDNHISIHAPRAGGDAFVRKLDAQGNISIHAPRAGGDSAAGCSMPTRRHFNPRPPCGGRRELHILEADELIFQSTPPVRGATYNLPGRYLHGGFQSTPPVRGATIRGYAIRRERGISIHAPRAGGDDIDILGLVYPIISIHAPRAGGDRTNSALCCSIFISIHAPRAGGD